MIEIKNFRLNIRTGNIHAQVHENGIMIISATLDYCVRAVELMIKDMPSCENCLLGPTNSTACFNSECKEPGGAGYIKKE